MRYSPWKLAAQTLALVSALGLTGFYAFSTKPSMRVVAHISGPDEASVVQALDSVESLLSSATRDGQRPDIAVIVTGAGVNAFKRSKLAVLTSVERLQGAGVRFAVGEENLQKLKVPDQDLPVGFIVVPNANYEIAKLRKQRYDYYRP